MFCLYVLSLWEPPANHFSCWRAWKRIFLTGRPAHCSLPEAWVCSNEGCTTDEKTRWWRSPHRNYWREQATGAPQLSFLSAWSAVSLVGLWGPRPCWGVHRGSDEVFCVYWTVAAGVKDAEVKAAGYLPRVSARGSRFLNMLFLCSPFQVKIQVLPSLPHVHPLWKISTVYVFLSRLIFRTTWTFFFCDVSKTGRKITFF